ncbi:MAG: primase [Candidatus Doudnabacteria bacterium]|nr:primase [Candidatus Doudnabacteria bacterium]
MATANSSILEIKDRLNIVDVLSSYIQLKKAGTNYKASCPFHNEKSASLMVSTSKQIWHCFGCGEGGDIFGFVMKYENIDFPEALKILADRAGVTLPKYSGENSQQDKYKETLFKINELAAKYFNEVLLRSSVAEAARKYLSNRGLSATTIKDWLIGFAPNEYHLLESFLAKKNFKQQELLDAGVAAKGQRGDYYDRFFNRITFPIKNYSGEVVGFTARILDNDAKAAKYINSPETQVYNKSKVVFGLYQAKQAIRKEDCAVVVEGNMDVISCHQAGFKNVVGSSGTAFTYDQLQTLSRLTKNLKFAFDTDAAGITATKRALELALQLGFSVYIVKIEGAKDPDELIRKDPKLFAKAVVEAPLYLDYFFEKSFEKYDPTSVQQKKAIVATLIPLLKQLNDPLEVAHYTHILSQRLSVSEKTVYELLAKDKPNTKTFSDKADEELKKEPLLRPRSYFIEQKLLGYALNNNNHRFALIEKSDFDYLRDPKIKGIFGRLWTDANKINGNVFIENLAEPEDQELAKMALFMVESEYAQLDNPSVFDQEFQQLLREFVSQNIKIEMESVRAEMVLAEQKKDKKKLIELNQKFLELSQKLSKL